MLVRHIVTFAVCCFVLPVSLWGSVTGQVEIRRIPVAEGLASHPVNGGNCLISDGQFQYIAFYDGQHRMTDGIRITALYCFRIAKDIFTLQVICTASPCAIIELRPPRIYTRSRRFIPGPAIMKIELHIPACLSSAMDRYT